MTASQQSEQALETQLERLRTVDTSDSARRVLLGIGARVRSQQRQVAIASAGASVAAIATLYFVLRGDPFGYFALTLATAVLIITAWRSAQKANYLTNLKSGASLLASWRAEIKRQLHHTLFAQLAALQFTAMTIWVVWKNGLPSLKSSLFLVVGAGIVVFAAYQILVVRPSLQRELNVLEQDE